MIRQLLPLLFLTTTIGHAQVTPPVSLTVVFLSQPVHIDNKPKLYYELHLRNNLQDSVRVTDLDIIDPLDDAIVFHVSGNNLLSRLALTSTETVRGIIPPFSSAVVYLEFELGNDVNSITHRLRVIEHHGNKSLIIAGADIEVPDPTPLVLGPPLAGGPWVAVYNAAWERGHRRVFYHEKGKQHLPGRFAIDFIRLDNAGRYAHGDEDSVANWHGYGNDVLSVADGIVVATRTDFAAYQTISTHRQPGAEDATGNYIAIQVGENQFAFYEHLKPRSIKVKPGQAVKKGEVIASLGFTGQSTGPHLHFHVADANSPLGAEGIPFVFEDFTLLGKYNNFEEFGKRLWQILKGAHPREIVNERPGPNSVIRFSH